MSLKRALLDLLYPPKCPFCGRVLDRGGEGMCERCRETLPWTAEWETPKGVDRLPGVPVPPVVPGIGARRGAPV